MLTVQVSIPELKAHAKSIREMAQDPMSTLQKLAGSLRPRFEAVTAYLEFPELEWMHLRTTNIIERVHKEFKRRTKPMEVVAGEASVYTILAFVAMKMEVSWRNAPFRNSGFRKLKPFADYFTHSS